MPPAVRTLTSQQTGFLNAVLAVYRNVEGVFDKLTLRRVERFAGDQHAPQVGKGNSSAAPANPLTKMREHRRIPENAVRRTDLERCDEGLAIPRSANGHRIHQLIVAAPIAQGSQDVLSVTANSDWLLDRPNVGLV